jgi:hypothetical protein
MFLMAGLASARNTLVKSQAYDIRIVCAQSFRRKVLLICINNIRLRIVVVVVTIYWNVRKLDDDPKLSEPYPQQDGSESSSIGIYPNRPGTAEHDLREQKSIGLRCGCNGHVMFIRVHRGVKNIPPLLPQSNYRVSILLKRRTCLYHVFYFYFVIRVFEFTLFMFFFI